METAWLRTCSSRENKILTGGGNNVSKGSRRWVRGTRSGRGPGWRGPPAPGARAGPYPVATVSHPAAGRTGAGVAGVATCGGGWGGGTKFAGGLVPLGALWHERGGLHPGTESPGTSEREGVLAGGVARARTPTCSPLQAHVHRPPRRCSSPRGRVVGGATLGCNSEPAPVRPRGAAAPGVS